ncbi:MAG: FAD-binding oxidoreductase [Polyangiaceae bacterium]|nr:FAD-binding oxidoreductase [Myxococcales bacterium]MCB9590146.1 FAD-binding oxidoreductase [Polyangiaceae bacterium]MCB9608025.1 FAD-binding oxidoreductase [Polyangiaceae bacterium]
MDVTRALKETTGVRCSTDAADRVAYARDLWPKKLIEIRGGQVADHRPLAVAWPETGEQVADIVRVARDEGLSLVPFGAGSGVCGGVLPDPTSIVLDLKGLRSWSIDESAPLIDVGAGAMGITLEEDIQRRGHTIGHFPSSILCSTVGGWIAARGAGQCSGRYGKIEDMVVSLELVTGRGELVTLERRQLGANLIPLIVGSEGTLGVITRAKLRLHAAPKTRTFIAYEFPSTEAGWEALRELFQAGLRPAVSRLYDPVDSFFLKQGAVKKPKTEGGKKHSGGGGKQRMLRGLLSQPSALNSLIEAAEGNLLGGATLVLIFEGEGEATAEDADRAIAICNRLGGKTRGEGPARHWLEHRYSVSYRQAPVFRLGAFSDTMEVAAPWSKLGTLYDAVRAALGKHVLVMAHLSHAYPDGCSIYFTFSGVAPDDEKASAKYDAAWRAAMDAAIGAGGTLSHHHGVGRSKAPRLGRELGFGVELVRRLQRCIDPDQLLNPGNLLPREDTPQDWSKALDEAKAPLGIDAQSLLATFRGEQSLQIIEEQLRGAGLSLRLSQTDMQQTLAAWLASGMPGARDAYSDPVEQRVAGLVARLPSGEVLGIRPTPRRAVGPDLSALVYGMGERCMRVEQATLCVSPLSARQSRDLAFDYARNPEPNPAEARLIDAVIDGVAHPSS